MALTQVVLTLDVYDGTGAPVQEGSAFLMPTAQLVDPTDHVVVWQRPVTVALEPPEGASDSWLPTVTLYSCDNADLSPSGWMWQVTFQAPGAPPSYEFALDYSNGADQYLSAQTPVVPTSGMASYALLSGATFTGQVAAPDFSASGLTGAASPSRYTGAVLNGPPLSGTFSAGDWGIDKGTGAVWVCVIAGTPGTWRSSLVYSAQSLTPFRAALANRQFSRCDVVCLGDSITEGQHATVQEYRWLARLRDRLRSRYPLLGAGLQPSLPAAGGQYLCAPSAYAPATQTSLTVSSATFAPVSSANVNTGNFTAPPSGSVVVTASFVAQASGTSPDRAVALAAHGTTSPLVCSQWVWEDSASIGRQFSVPMLVTGLTPGSVYNFDLMAAVASGSLTFYAYGQTSTTVGNSSASYGAPVTMTVQAAGMPGTGGRGFLGVATSGESSYTWPLVVAGSPSAGTTLGPKSQFVNLANGTQTVTCPLVGDSADIMWCQVPFGGFFGYSVDGGSVTTVSTNGGSQVDGKVTHVSLGTMGAHTLVISWSSGATASITGVTEYCGDYSSGIHVHDCGHFGWTTANWVTELATGSQGPAAAIAALTPNLVVITLGVNDQFAGTAPSVFASNLQSIISDLKAQLTSPYPAFLINMLPPRTGQSGYTYPWSQYVAAAWAVALADTSGPGSTPIVTVLDCTQGPALPGADTDVYGVWQGGDLVHLSNLGHQAVADWLADCLTAL